MAPGKGRKLSSTRGPFSTNGGAGPVLGGDHWIKDVRRCDEQFARSWGHLGARPQFQRHRDTACKPVTSGEMNASGLESLLVLATAARLAQRVAHCQYRCWCQCQCPVLASCAVKSRMSDLTARVSRREWAEGGEKGQKKVERIVPYSRRLLDY